MKIPSKDFRVPPGEKVKLSEWPTRMKPYYKSKKGHQKLLEEHVEQLSALQQTHYASNRFALLVIFQAMDAAGKDGAIRHVMSGINPQGCAVFSFKQPSPEELEHDFLWRTTCRLPERGEIGIFNSLSFVAGIPRLQSISRARCRPQLGRCDGMKGLMLFVASLGMCWLTTLTCRADADKKETANRHGAATSCRCGLPAPACKAG